MKFSPIEKSEVSSDIEMQLSSLDVWDFNYRLTTKDGVAIDATIDDTYKRVARALASVEVQSKREHFNQEFLWALRGGAIPAGRIISNAGAQEHKPATSMINCTVSGTVGDSMDNILNKVHEAGLTLKAGCGIGYEFSTLRPKGAYVTGAGAYTSGPLSFMDIYDKMCFTVSSVGGRRGAQMGTFDVGHPDIMEFIRAKREDGRLRQFNLSLLVTDEFMQAVINEDDWSLAFPVTQKEVDDDELDLEDTTQFVWREWPEGGNYASDARGLVACKIYKTLPARHVWDLIMASTYDFAEPSFVLIDKVNEMNNNWFDENIRATNPCGEQPLPPYGSCLLGSVNLTRFVVDPFTDSARFDWDAFRKVVKVFTRMLDNVVEINGLPLPQQRNEIQRKRRHGMGFLGLGSTITMLRLEYGDEKSVEFTEEVARQLALAGWQEGLELAREKGPAPIMSEQFEVTEEMLRKRPEMTADGYQVGDKVPGRILHARYSRYMQRIAAEAPQLVDELAETGARFTHHSSISPTGTISLALANNASNGIEPSFAHHYFRNVIRQGKKTKKKVDVYSFELLAYRELVDKQAMPASATDDSAGHNLPEYFVTAGDVSPKSHVDIQAAAQKWIDSSISKTANVPTDYPYEDFKDIYLYAYEQGLKGCTTFRFNPEAFQGVLVKEQDLQNTIYSFVFDDGTENKLKGNEEIDYDGELHTAANLFDALKEGYYGKFGGESAGGRAIVRFEAYPAEMNESTGRTVEQTKIVPESPGDSEQQTEMEQSIVDFLFEITGDDELRDRIGSIGLVEITRFGLAVDVLDAIAARYQLNTSEIERLIGISGRTLARRREKNEMLTTVETDRLLRFFRAVVSAEEVFEDVEITGRWMKRSNRILWNKTPLSLLDTDLGTARVLEVLGQIDHGVYR